MPAHPTTKRRDRAVSRASRSCAASASTLRSASSAAVARLGRGVGGRLGLRLAAVQRPLRLLEPLRRLRGRVRALARRRLRSAPARSAASACAALQLGEPLRLALAPPPRRRARAAASSSPFARGASPAAARRLRQLELGRSAPSTIRPARSRSAWSASVSAACSSARTRSSIGSESARPFGRACSRTRLDELPRRLAVGGHRLAQPGPGRGRLVAQRLRDVEPRAHRVGLLAREVVERPRGRRRLRQLRQLGRAASRSPAARSSLASRLRSSTKSSSGTACSRSTASSSWVTGSFCRAAG